MTLQNRLGHGFTRVICPLAGVNPSLGIGNDARQLSRLVVSAALQLDGTVARPSRHGGPVEHGTVGGMAEAIAVAGCVVS